MKSLIFLLATALFVMSAIPAQAATSGGGSASGSAASSSPGIPAMRLPNNTPTVGNTNPTAPIGGNTPTLNSTSPLINNSANPGSMNPSTGAAATPGGTPCNTAGNVPGAMGSGNITGENNDAEDLTLNGSPATNPATGALNAMEPSCGTPNNTGTATSPLTPGASPCQ
jgi:hypothetical protein